MSRDTSEQIIGVAELRRRLQELSEAGALLRRGLPAFDERAWRDDALALAQRSEDPAAIEAVWDYREGKIDRFELRAHPAFSRVLTAHRQQRLEELERSGALGILRQAARDERDP